MPRAQRGQAIRAVGGGVFLIAHAQVGGVQQAHQRGQHQRASQRLAVAVRCKVARHAAAQAREHAAKRLHVFELALVALRAPLRVVTVLAPSARVQPRGLQVPVGQGANPHVGISRWDSQAFDAGDLVRVLQPLAIGQTVAESLGTAAHAGEAGHGGCDVHQASGELLGAAGGPGWCWCAGRWGQGGHRGEQVKVARVWPRSHPCPGGGGVGALRALG